jgi:hypothetical protein
VLDMYRNMCLRFMIFLIRSFLDCVTDNSVNGKKVEIAVKQIICGNVGVQVSGTVGNPESLEEYRQFIDVERIHRERSHLGKL